MGIDFHQDIEYIFVFQLKKDEKSYFFTLPGVRFPLHFSGVSSSSSLLSVFERMDKRIGIRRSGILQGFFESN